MRDLYDVVVVGGGAAGLAGALALGRSRRSVLVVDAGEPRNASAEGVHNYLTSEGMPPRDLVAAGRAEVAGYGVEVVDGLVRELRPVDKEAGDDGDDGDGSRFAVELADGPTVRARRLLVTAGVIDELPAIDGLAGRWGRDVLHCPYCHGWEVRDRAVGVIGTGPLAVHSAMLFRQLTDDVVLIRHAEPVPWPSSQDAAALAARGVTVVDGEVAAVEVAGDRLVGARLRSGEVIERDALVVASRPVVRGELFVGLGLEPADVEMHGQTVATHIPADGAGATSVPGVWVAGNVTDPMGQVIGAAAAGLKAGAAINADLVAEDADLAVASAGTLAPAPG
ncbi:NAD(P)/FAD-dependent oxidoreductase [Jiangella asiatica]|uniref:NAD(P)/FAD-dependent oxidoreductase n=1 Tax=Jiangella asiatica TaxID=2530372 RepID=A0A4R5CJR3_9ACTN|nr:NAD(P)/FAD-dependent oxidoreductase [Jiangella asiatica]TDE00096.1 NAD(P)/FAD-dependent oxidoreductase [Jiangella asiatica]